MTCHRRAPANTIFYWLRALLKSETAKYNMCSRTCSLMLSCIPYHLKLYSSLFSLDVLLFLLRPLYRKQVYVLMRLQFHPIKEERK